MAVENGQFSQHLGPYVAWEDTAATFFKKLCARKNTHARAHTRTLQRWINGLAALSYLGIDFLKARFFLIHLKVHFRSCDGQGSLHHNGWRDQLSPGAQVHRACK